MEAGAARAFAYANESENGHPEGAGTSLERAPGALEAASGAFINPSGRCSGAAGAADEAAGGGLDQPGPGLGAVVLSAASSHLICLPTLVFYPHQPRLVSWLTALAGTFFLLGCWFINAGTWLFGTLIIVMGLVPCLLHKGGEFDLARRSFRSFVAPVGLGALRMGSWEALPPIVGVTIKYFAKLVTSGRPGRMRTDNIESFIVMLSVQDSTQGIIIGEYGLHERARAEIFAQEIADHLAVPLKIYERR